MLASAISLLAISAAHAACPSLPTLRSAKVASSFDARLAQGLFYENRFTDLAQIGASCQHMNKTAQPDHQSIAETYTVNYGPLPFPLPLMYNATPGQRGVSSRYMALFPEVQFPSVVMDYDMDNATGMYGALLEYLCWPMLGLDYVELRISTRDPAPPGAYLDELEARARALGAVWDGSLTQVNFSGCPAPAPAPAPPRSPTRLAPWAKARARLAAGASPLRDPADDLVLPGLNPGKPQIALVFIQGAECAPSGYAPLLRALQAALPGYNLIAGAPDAPLIHTPDPVSLGLDVARILDKMEASAGLVLKDAKVVFAAHSLGGLMMQDWLAVADFVSYEPAAVLLLGSYVTRSNRPGINASAATPTFRFPTASLVGELDGLARVSRFAEAFWWQQAGKEPAPPPALRALFPVLHVAGMNHGQWAHFEGPPPSEVATYDLAPEVGEGEAQAAGAALMAAFIDAVVGGSSVGAAAIAAAQAASAAFFAPLLAALVYESSYNLLPPCYDAPPSPSCRVGSDFSQRAQLAISNAAGGGGAAPFAFGMRVVDAMHPVADITPIHLSNITSRCAAPTAACTLAASTVTENSYDPLYAPLDVALYPVSAHEVKVKMTSRQNGLLHAGVPPAQAPFNVTDADPLCAVANAQTLAWAVAHAAPAAAARYAARGLPLRFGPDNIGFAGPQFTDGTLAVSLVTQPAPGGAGNVSFVWVNSTSLPTPIPYFVKLAEGFRACPFSRSPPPPRLAPLPSTSLTSLPPPPDTPTQDYCLLLSPARAMEFIYVDGLRNILVQ